MEQLSLAALEAHDPYAPNGAIERRFFCPFPDCDDKQFSASHRSLSANTDTGLYICHRCENKGKLMDVGENGTAKGSPGFGKRERARRRFSVTPSESEPLQPIIGHWGTSVLEHPRSLTFLQKRCLPPGLVARSGALRCARLHRYSDGIVFPLYDRDERLIAVHSRSLGDEAPKAKTLGKKSHALFSTPWAFEADTFAITEAPLDALALAACGLPAVAMLGTAMPSFLRQKVLSKSVLVATDADDSGDRAAESLFKELPQFGARVTRLRPPCKDWNEALSLYGASWMRRAIGSPTSIMNPGEKLLPDSALWTELLQLVEPVGTDEGLLQNTLSLVRTFDGALHDQSGSWEIHCAEEVLQGHSSLEELIGHHALDLAWALDQLRTADWIFADEAG